MRVVRIPLVALLFAAACAGAIDDQSGPSPSGPDRPRTASSPNASPSAPNPGVPNSAVPVAAAPAAPAAAAGCGYIPARIYRLTPAQLRRSYAALLGMSAPGDDLQQTLDGALPDAKPFSNGEAVLAGSPVFVETIFNGLERSVAAAVASPAALHPCLAAGITRLCMTNVVTEFGVKAWRRPWSNDEIQSYLTFFDTITAKSDAKRGLEYVLRRMLTAPDFLFRFELGGAPDASGNVNLTSDELATSLAYVLTDSPPDALLKSAAAMRGLESKESVAAQARRLLDTPDLGSGIFDFFADLFDGKQTGHADQAEEQRRFVSHAVWTDTGKLSSLLNADYTVINPALQKFYGWTKLPAVKGWEKVSPPAAEGRAGLLGSGVFLSRNSNRSARGKFVRGLLLCTEVPDPPPNVSANLDMAKIMAAGQLGRPATEDEARAAHLSNPACAGCHRLIDPIGKPLVAFDQHGVWQATNPETKKPYDTSTEIADAAEINGAYKDSRSLIGSLAAARTVGDCVARHVYEYALGRTLQVGDQCHVRAAAAKFAQSGGDVRQLFVDVVASDAFRVRSTRK